MSAAVAGASTATIGALGALIAKAQETAFQMQKMAQTAGIIIESFSKMAYAAKVSGMPVDQMAIMLAGLSQTAMLAAAGSEEQAWAYKSLGISVQDANGKFKTADTLMMERVKKMDGFRDSSDKIGIETMLMGRSGAQAAEVLHNLATRFDESLPVWQSFPKYAKLASRESHHVDTHAPSDSVDLSLIERNSPVVVVRKRNF